MTTLQLVASGVAAEQAEKFAGDKIKMLHAASKAGALEVVQFLAKHCDGIDLNARDKACACGAAKVYESTHPYKSK